MNLLKLIVRNFTFYRRQHLGTIIGTVLSTAIITGALVVGDSVRGSLQDIVNDRLGPVNYALELQHRYFRTGLAGKLSGTLKTPVACLLKTDGIALVPGEQEKVRQIQILGVDSSFARLTDQPEIYTKLADDMVLVNLQLANDLQIKAGDEILIRFRNLDFMPDDTPIAGKSEKLFARRFKIKAIISQPQPGNFNLRINQATPNNVFMSARSLANIMDLNGFANTVLIAARNQPQLNAGKIQAALKKIWHIDDAGFDIVPLKNSSDSELRSRRVFFDSETFIFTGEQEDSVTPILTYLVNTISTGQKTTPYSFISAAGKPIVPGSMRDDEIIINSWLSADLAAKAGDSLRIDYFVPGPAQRLDQKSRQFVIRSVVPLSGIYTDRGLMPSFPGLADMDNCRDWESGFPIDLEQIRKKDEDYWDTYRGTPKAFVTLKAARSMWQNRFGNSTAIRYKNMTADSIRHMLTKRVQPEQLGFTITPVREQGLKATTESVDFSGLFIGLSFFIIVAALLLISLLYHFSMEQRSQETGLYFALGFPRLTVLKILLGESIILTIIGSGLGAALSIFYTRIVLQALRTIWLDAVGTSALQIHIQPISILTGFLIGMFTAVITLYFTIHRFSKANTHRLQSGDYRYRFKSGKRKTWLGNSVGVILVASALIIIINTDPGRSKEAAGSFFIAGFLALAAGLILTNGLFNSGRGKIATPGMSLIKIGIRNTARRKGRSLMLTGILASSLFIVFTVGANRTGSEKNSADMHSGTGGFSYYGETVFPLSGDLNDREFSETLGLGQGKTNDRFVQMRMTSGDDASCLNLNRVAAPRLLGLDPILFSKPERFEFINKSGEISEISPWLELEKTYPGNVIPGIADETVIIWGLGKSVGDTITYLNESGQILPVKLIAGLANSVFQGNIIISEKNMIANYPSVSGYNILLATGDDVLADQLAWALRDYGLNLTSTADRLAVFNRVQNTYLAIFLILGALGMILGTIGIAVVVIRNVYERRNELAIMRVVGFEKRALYKVVFTEQVIIIGAGITIGFLSSILAVLPALASPDAESSILLLAFLIIIISANAFFWTYMAIRYALSGNLLLDLKND